MKEVTVKKAKLLKTLKRNKKTHEADFEIAWVKFKERAVHNFEERLRQLKNLRKGEVINLTVNLPIPQNHVEDYERAIQMIDWETGDEVVLTEYEFQQYVQDDWGWKGAFATSNAFYTGVESPSASSISAAYATLEEQEDLAAAGPQKPEKKK